MGMGAGPGAMGYFSRPALSLVAQVRLRDGTLVTFDSRQPASAESLPYRLLASLAVLLVGVLLVSLLAVRWATRPLNTLADAAEELGRDIQRPPLPEAGPVEVRRAARAFNTMQSPETRSGDDTAARIEAQTIEQIARVKTVVAQLESWRDELRQDRRHCVAQHV